MSEQHTPGRLTVHIDGADGWPLLLAGDLVERMGASFALHNC